MELDESLGILSPGDMKDFTLSSMTQSLVSVTSLPRDVSCDDLDSAGDKTVTEECELQVTPAWLTCNTPIDILLSYGQLQSQKHPRSRSAGRFCLDSDKLQEIESLTEASPTREVPHTLSDIAEVSERSLHGEEDHVDPVAKLLSERTKMLLQKSSKKRKVHKTEKMTKSEAEGKSEAAICVREKSEERVEIINRNTASPAVRRQAWPWEEDHVTHLEAAEVPTSEDVDTLHIEETFVQLSESVKVNTELELEKEICHSDGSQMVDTNDGVTSVPDDTETNGEEKEKCDDTQSMDQRNVIDDTADKGME